MALIRFTTAARWDGVEIIRYLKREAGAPAAHFERHFDDFYLRIDATRNPVQSAASWDQRAASAWSDPIS